LERPQDNRRCTEKDVSVQRITTLIYFIQDSDTKVGALFINDYIAMVAMVVHKWLYLSEYSATPKPSSSAGFVTHFMCPLL
jgi:hypothetical protein